MIGHQRIGWSKDRKKVKFGVLVQLDSEIERDAFIGLLDSLGSLIDDMRLEELRRRVRNGEEK